MYPEKTMWEKIKEIINSPRFLVVTVAAGMALLELRVGHILTAEAALNVLKIWLATVAGIGTLDSIATKIGGGK